MDITSTLELKYHGFRDIGALQQDLFIVDIATAGQKLSSAGYARDIRRLVAFTPLVSHDT